MWEGSLSEQLALARDQGRLRPICDIQFSEDAAHMGAHRRGADAEIIGNLQVRLAVGEQPKHVKLALSEVIEGGRGRPSSDRDEGPIYH